MIAILLLSVLAQKETPTALLDHALKQWQATPEMRVEDAYKWLYHATLGGEHAVQDESGPKSWMDAEWPTVGTPLKGEPEIVPLTPDGRLVRINLRPYKAHGGDKEMLLWAFVLSAQRFHADRSEFVRAWGALGARLKRSPWLQLSNAEWSRLDKATRRDAYPAIEHSRPYEERYKPAYRVVLRELWVIPSPPP